MQTYQDYLKATDVADFISKAISQHMASEEYRTARDAELYDKQRNVTINRLMKAYRDTDSESDRSDLCIASNWFSRFNTQRASYLLGNGVSFTKREKRVNDEGVIVSVDVVKERVGVKFDNGLYWWGYTALIEGVSFGMWTGTELRVFPLTEFVPLWDEDTGALRAGIRFWRLAPNKPMRAEVYTEDGYTVWQSRDRSAGMDMVTDDEQPRPYEVIEYKTEHDGVIDVQPLTTSTLPIIPMWGSYKKQSTLVGFRDNIDCYDLVKSGFCNDMRDTAKIYWLIENCGGMTRKDMDEFLDDIRRRHIAKVDSESFSGDARAALTPYTVDVPYQGNKAVLDQLARDMYSDFGAVDTSRIPAGATNDQIESAFLPLDEEADLFEVQVIEAVQQLLKLMGIEDTPQFKRNRTTNITEIVDAVMKCASYLDPEAVLNHIPFITVDERDAILQRTDAQNAGRLIDPNRVKEIRDQMGADKTDADETGETA